MLPLLNDCLSSQQLGLKLICWHGLYRNVKTVWLRWVTLNGELLLLPEEIAAQYVKAETRWADAEAQRAARFAQILREQGIDPDLI